MKTLIVLSGVPGSGKTTWAKKYAKENKNCYILCLDKIRYKVTRSFNDFSKQDKVWAIFDNEVEKLLKKKSVTVIVDSLNHKNSYRLEYLKIYKGFNNYVLVIFNKKEKDIIHYNKCRNKNKWVKENDIKKLLDIFEYPSKEVQEKYNKVLIINDYV